MPSGVGRDGFAHDTAYHDPGHGANFENKIERGAQEGMSAAHGQSGAYAAFELLDDDAIIEL